MVTVKITIPGEQDLAFFEKIGHIVFRIDQMKDTEAIQQTLLNHISRERKSGRGEGDPVLKNITLEELNRNLDL